MSKSSIFIIALLVLVSSCRKDNSPYWDVDVLFPLAHTELKLQNILPDSNLQIDSTNALTFIFNTNLFSLKLDSVFSIPDTTTKDGFQLPVGSVTLQPGQNFLADTQETKYELGGAELKFLNLRSGTIDIALSSTLSEKTVFKYTVPSATLQGIPLSLRIEVPAGSQANPSTVTRKIDLKGYDFNLTGQNNDDFNVIYAYFTAHIDSAGQAVLVSQNDKFEITYTYKDMLLEQARGYFGSDVINETSGGDPLDAFNAILSGYLALNQAEIKVSIINELGLDIGAQLHEVTAINTANNESVSLQGPLIGKQINLNRATSGPGYPPIYRTKYEGILNNNNSNVAAFISNLPNLVSYDVSAHMNPLGNVSGGNDFVFYNTGVVVRLDAAIPLKFSATNLSLVDTAEFALDNSIEKQTRRINSGFINIYAENWYPISGVVQFYFYDSNMVLLDSLFDIPAIIPAATPDLSTGIVTIPESSEVQAPVSGTKIDRLYRAAFVKTFVTVNTSHQPEKVQFYDNYKMDLTMVGDFNYNLIVNDL